MGAAKFRKPLQSASLFRQKEPKVLETLSIGLIPFFFRGAVGNAEWTGVPLCALLERAGLRSRPRGELESRIQSELSSGPSWPGLRHSELK